MILIVHLEKLMCKTSLKGKWILRISVRAYFKANIIKIICPAKEGGEWNRLGNPEIDLNACENLASGSITRQKSKRACLGKMSLRSCLKKKFRLMKIKKKTPKP